MRLKDSSEPPHSGFLYRRGFAGFIIDECRYGVGLKQSKHSCEPVSFGILLQCPYTEQVGNKARTCGPNALAYTGTIPSRTVI
ncbi:MAG TPA: hypothetical protein VF762_23305 [Blastocatellia bacterium]